MKIQRVRCEDRGMRIDKVNLDKMLNRFGDHWSPKTVGRLNDYELKVVKVQGEFVWHQHDETDESSSSSTGS
jgi:hypothetical protein